MHTVTLVILDCDGVLVDGELIAHGIYARQFSSIGFPLTTTECLQRFSGTCEQDMVEEVEREQGLTLSPDFKQALHESVLEAFKTQLQPMPGVGAFLRTLRDSNIQFCVATNGKPDRVRYALTHTNLIEYFPPQQIFDISLVKRGKPSPDLFLRASQECNSAHTECLVIDDSILGIRAAHAAFMPVAGFLGGSHAQERWYEEKLALEHPTYLIKSMEELAEKIISHEW